MNKIHYHVEAAWDPDAEVWVATSEDVPGLVTEADTMEALTRKLRVMIPELLEANHVLTTFESGAISFEIKSFRQEDIRLAS